MKRINHFLLGSLLFSAFFFPVSVQAAEKEQSVQIEKNYGEAVFHFDFATEQEYEITITDSYGNAKVCTVNTNAASVSILNPTVGEYSILITAEEDISVESKVELKNQLNITPDDKISVSSVISGLHLYFADGSICGSWNDTQIGSVNVTITNTKNMQILYSNTVKDTAFSYELADTVEEIQIYLVPTNNAKTEGAGVSYTLEVVRDLPGEVQFPNQSITNQDGIDAELFLQEDLDVIVTENSSVIYEEEIESGEHSLYIPLAGIDNRIEVILMDAKGNFITYPYYIERDIIAPTIKLKGEYDNTKTYGDTIEIKGTLTDAVTLLCNDIKVNFEQPSFTIRQELDNIGVNEIVLKALDEAGNEAVIALHITRAERNYTGLIIVLILLFLASGGIVFFRIKRRAELNKPLAEAGKEETEQSAHYDSRLEYESTHDEMTGLFNRTAYKKRLAAITKEKMCVIYFDVNNLKRTNDLLGHQYGDKLLSTVAAVIDRNFPRATYRIGGDEFVVLLENEKTRVIDKKLRAIDKELDEKSRKSTEKITYQVAYGYAFGNKKDSVDTTIQKADKKMYFCKKQKKDKGLSNRELKQMSDARTRQEKEKAEKMLKKMWLKDIIGNHAIALMASAAIIILVAFCVENSTVASGSMEPTLMTGDHVVFNRLAYTVAEIQRGDIISFNSQEYNKNMGKRVIGIAGDHIEFHDGYVFINGALCIEPYLEEDVETNCSKEFDVPEGCVFVMGDNREQSTDSRFFNNPYIPVEDIVGKYLGHFPF